MDNLLYFVIILGKLGLLGLFMVSIGRIARVICYQGGVCDFLFNQLQTTINAKNTALANFKAGMKQAFAPSLKVA